MKVEIEQIDRFLLIPENDSDVAILNNFFLEANGEHWTMSIKADSVEQLREFEHRYQQKINGDISALSFQLRKTINSQGTVGKVGERLQKARKNRKHMEL